MVWFSALEWTLSLTTFRLPWIGASCERLARIQSGATMSVTACLVAADSLARLGDVPTAPIPTSAPGSPTHTRSGCSRDEFPHPPADPTSLDRNPNERQPAMTTYEPGRPTADEHIPYYEQYIRLVPDGNVIDILTRQIQETAAFLASLTPERARWRPAPGE